MFIFSAFQIYYTSIYQTDKENLVLFPLIFVVRIEKLNFKMLFFHVIFHSLPDSYTGNQLFQKKKLLVRDSIMNLLPN